MASEIFPAENNVYSYFDLCGLYCAKSFPLFAFVSESVAIGSPLKITFPKFAFGDKELYIGDAIYHKTLKNENNTLFLEDATTGIIHIILQHKSQLAMDAWENSLVDFVAELNNLDSFQLMVGATSDTIIQKEIQKMGARSSRGLILSLGVLILFLVICSLRSDLREMKAFESIAGAFIPVLVMITSIGIVLITGYPVQTIVVAVMFLILAIAIDDVFLMISCWHRTSKESTIAERTALTVQSSGSSMTVTTITNVISFGNGVLSTMPVLQCFAIYGTVASIIGYVYQLLLFPCFLALGAYRETRITTSKSCFPKTFHFAAQLDRFRFFLCSLIANLSINIFAQVFVILMLIIYWFGAITGVVNMEVELAIQHLLPPRSELVKIRAYYDEAVKDCQMVVVIVKNPGDLRNETRFARLRQMIKDFESLNWSYGASSTQSFLQALDDNSIDKLDYPYLEETFIASDEVNEWKGTLRLNAESCVADNESCIEEFMFTTGFKDLVRYVDVSKIMQEWRKLREKYHDFDIYAYTERSDFADTATNLLDTIFWTIASEVICMIIVFIFFIPNIASIIAATFCLCSVNFGVLGYLNLWGVGVDPFSLASLLMSVGFSVDICAHVSYHFYELKAQPVRDKIEKTLLDIGWATLQGSLSTILAMSPTVFWDSYLLSVFFKTVTLVNIFGILHGLIILPVILSIVSNVSHIFNRLFGCTPNENAIASSVEMNRKPSSHVCWSATPKSEVP